MKQKLHSPALAIPPGICDKYCMHQRNPAFPTVRSSIAAAR